MTDLFKVGDIVGSIHFEGCRKLISSDSLDYPLRAEDCSTTYLLDGKISNTDAHPSIWHWETGSPTIAGERPVEPIHSIEDYNCPYAHIEKDCGHQLHESKGHVDVYSIWCDCGYHAPVFVTDPVELGLQLKED